MIFLGSIEELRSILFEPLFQILQPAWFRSFPTSFFMYVAYINKFDIIYLLWFFAYSF